jgi:hypothetical protein
VWANIGLRNDEVINTDVDQPTNISFAVTGVGRVLTLTNLTFDWAPSAQFSRCIKKAVATFIQIVRCKA